MDATLYLISYDLNQQKNYPDLLKALKDLGAKKILFSEWLLRRGSTTSKAIADHLLRFVDGDDSIFVCEVDDYAWRGTMVDPRTV